MVHKFHLGRKFISERFYPPELFHPKSFRVIESGGYKFTVGVPTKALKTNAIAMPLYADSRFRAPTRVQKMMHPVGKFKKKHPAIWKKLKASKTKTVLGKATHLPKSALVAG